LREGLVKTGWASWENKWREEIFKQHKELITKRNVAGEKEFFER